MVRNDAPPEISIDPETYQVRIDAVHRHQAGGPAALIALMRSALAAYPTVLAGATELPHGCGTAVRLLGTSSTAVQAVLRSAWSPPRLEPLGAPAPNLRTG